MPAARLALPVVLSAALLLAGCAGAPGEAADAPEPQPTQLPASMAALGDSITAGFLSCGRIADCPEVSWSTGTQSGIASHATRLAQLGGSRPAVHDLAVSGATVSGLGGQVRRAVGTGAEYVTVLIGANDACASTEAGMTSLQEFDRLFAAALDELVAGLPEARVLVASVPDLERLRELGAERPEPRGVWDRFRICPTALAGADDDGEQADARRGRVRERVEAYNEAMAQACARHATCRWDGGAVFDDAFAVDDVNQGDWFHPSPEGQRRLAEVTWQAGWFAGEDEG